MSMPPRINDTGATIILTLTLATCILALIKWNVMPGMSWWAVTAPLWAPTLTFMAVVVAVMILFMVGDYLRHRNTQPDDRIDG